MTKVNKGTKLYNSIMWEYNNLNKGDINEAYNKPSAAKVRTFNDIWFRARQTAGYNHDLKVVTAGSQFYSTIYSFVENGIKYLVKDTYANTYILAI